MNDDNMERWQHYLLHTQLLIQCRKSLCPSFHNNLWKTKDHKLLLCKIYYLSKGNAYSNKRKIILVTRYFYVRENIWVPSHLSLLQGIFPNQGWNSGLLHCRQILYQLSHKGTPSILEWVAYPFSRKSSQPRNWTGVSCIAGGFFTNWALREAHLVTWRWTCKSLSCVWLFVTPWTFQSMEFSHRIQSTEFSRPEYWSG